MANVYVYSGAVGAGTGANWANAFTTLAAAASSGSAGDVFYVAHNHAETQASAMTITFPGTVAAPNFVYCANSAGTVPPVSADLRATATVSTTGANNITVNGSVYGYGIIFQCGSGAVTPSLLLAQATGNTQFWDTCALNIVATGSSVIGLGTSTGGAKITLNNTTMQPNATGTTVNLAADFTWKNTASAITTGSALPTSLFNPSNARPSALFCEGIDLSALGSGKTLVGSGGAACNPFTFKDCKLGASVTVASTPAALSQPAIQLIRCDSGAVNYRSEKYTYAGTQTIETTIVRTGGASDGTTTIAWKLVTTANSKWKFPFECFPITIWSDTTGAKTVTIEGVWGGGAVPLNDEIWIDVEYLGSALTPIGSYATSSKADGLATGANCTASTETWGGSTTKFKMSATLTTAMKGPITVYVKAAKASSTFYIDPKITIS
jgi:hypothetical protein